MKSFNYKNLVALTNKATFLQLNNMYRELRECRVSNCDRVDKLELRILDTPSSACEIKLKRLQYKYTKFSILCVEKQSKSLPNRGGFKCTCEIS